MLKKDNPATKVWAVVYPLGMYYAVIVIVMYLAQWILGADESHYMLCQIIASVAAIPVIYPFYRQDRTMDRSESTQRESDRQKAEAQIHPAGMRKYLSHALWIIVISACIGISLNNIISMSPLVSVSEGYAEASRNFYGSTIALELLGSAIITPLLEELLYRGIIYARIRQMAGMLPAVLISALVFALMHFNLVQFLYAFLLGIVLALFMEKTGHMYGAVIGHMTANAIAVVRTETGFLSGTVDGSLPAWLISAGICFLGAVILMVYWRKGERKE